MNRKSISNSSSRSSIDIVEAIKEKKKKKKKHHSKAERRRRKRQREESQSTQSLLNQSSEDDSSISKPPSLHTTSQETHSHKVESHPLKQNMFVRDIQFVYPTSNMSTSSTPYIFTQLRTDNTARTTPTTNFITTTTQASKYESIDDILGINSSIIKPPPEPKNIYYKFITDDRSPPLPTEVHSMDTKPLSGRTTDDAVRDIIGRRPRSNSTDGVLNLPQCGLCDEVRVLESHQWTHLLTNTKTSLTSMGRLLRPRGLINLGNTCFLNATLQCLAYLPTFSQCVMSLPSKHSQSPEGKKHQWPGKKITMYIQHVLGKMHGLDDDNISSPLAPRTLYSAIPLLGGCARGYTFRPGRQEDAHEFLIHLLDTMQNGELLAAGINPKQSGWRDRLPIPRLDETTFIHRVFGGYLRSQVICTLCGYKSNTYDPFLDLALEVNKSSSLMAALQQFMKKETLDVANKWKCSGCNNHVCATKQLTVFRPPLSLIVQLKRFGFGGQGISTFHRNGGFSKFSNKESSRSKIQKPIDFSTCLELPLSDGRCCEYYLTGIIVHEGGSATSGHYTACIRKPGSGHNRDEWYLMDDGSVSKMSEQAVLQVKNAYVLFYTRKEVQLALPKPPSRSFDNAEEAIKAVAARSRARADSLISLDHARSADTSLPKAMPKDNSTDLFPSFKEQSTTFVSSSDTSTKNHSSLSTNILNLEGHKSDKDKRKSIKINRGAESIQVFLHNGKKTNVWSPSTKAEEASMNRNGISLLGNRAISTWDDDDENNKDNNDVVQKLEIVSEKRKVALAELTSHDKERKRKMFLNHWDSALDAGKQKKIKKHHQTSPGKHGWKNPFHSLQQTKMTNNKKGYFNKFQNKKK